MRYDLEIRFDARNSFYGKAQIEEKNNELILYSYGLKICKIVDGEFIKIGNYYSQTTMRHINEFRLQNNFKKLSKKEWESIELISE